MQQTVSFVQVAFMDGNGSLHMQRVTLATDQAVQLHVHVTAIRWHDTADILAALSPAQLVIACPSSMTCYKSVSSLG